MVASLDSFLVAHWTMNDNAANSTVLDSSGNNYNGTFYSDVNSNTSAHSVAGVIGRALSFDGVGDYIDTGQIFQSIFRDSFSVSLLVKINAFIGADENLFAVADEQGVNVVECWWSAYYSKLLFNYANPSGNVSLITSALQSGVWYHIVFIVKNNGTTATATLYLNNVMVGTDTETVTMSSYTSSDNVLLGCYRGVELLNGILDDVRLYNKALSVAEINYLWDNGQGKQ
jgi:hypothetical protein